MTDPIKLALEALEKIAAYRPGSTDAGMSPWDAKAALAALDAIPQPAPVPGDAELDVLQERLADECAVLGAKASRALSALRTRLAEVDGAQMFRPINEDTPRDGVLLVCRATWWTPVNNDHRWIWSLPIIASWDTKSKSWTVGAEKQPTHWAPVPKRPHLDAPQAEGVTP